MLAVDHLKGDDVSFVNVQNRCWRGGHHRDMNQQITFCKQVAGNPRRARVCSGGARPPTPFRPGVVSTEDLHPFFVINIDAGRLGVTGLEHFISDLNSDGSSNINCGGGLSFFRANAHPP